jgi:death on curing protein
LPTSKNAVYGINAVYIEYLHDFGISLTWPGLEPVPQYDCLDLNLLYSAAKQPLQAGFGVEFYPTLHDKAACYFFLLAGGHIFRNGNKRTAVLVLDQFMWANSYYLSLSNTEVKKLAENTAKYKSRGKTNKEAMEEISAMVKANSFPIKALRRIRPSMYRKFHRIKNAVRRALASSSKEEPAQARLQRG